LLLLPGRVLLFFFSLVSSVISDLSLIVLCFILSLLLVGHRSGVSILLSELVLGSGCLHAISSVVITDVVFGVIESVRSSLVKLATIFGLLHLLLLAHAFRALRSVSGMAERLAFFNLLVNEDVLWLTVVELSLLLLLLIERGHSELLVGQSLVLTARRTISIMSVVSEWRIFTI
jgi:hypothetical protein